tara:strand:+ start:997 stop:1176 length:180 start_codon:yes stop_codon:yes gene_type:complete
MTIEEINKRQELHTESNNRLKQRVLAMQNDIKVNEAEIYYNNGTLEILKELEKEATTEE